jgi:hypothetical protein
MLNNNSLENFLFEKMKTQRNGNIEKCTLLESDEREKNGKGKLALKKRGERKIDKRRRKKYC